MIWSGMLGSWMLGGCIDSCAMFIVGVFIREHFTWRKAIKGGKQIIYSKSKMFSALITRFWLCDDGVKHGFHVCFCHPNGVHGEAPLNAATVRGVASWRLSKDANRYPR